MLKKERSMATRKETRTSATRCALLERGRIISSVLCLERFGVARQKSISHRSALRKEQGRREDRRSCVPTYRLPGKFFRKFGCTRECFAPGRKEAWEPFRGRLRNELQ